MRMPRIPTIVATFALLIWLMIPSQEGDPGFNPSVESPANTTAHLRVYFDAGHWNVHKADGRYKPFADLLRSDGYEIVLQKGEFTAKKLEGFQLLVIANALGLRGAAQQVVNIFHGDKYLHMNAAAFTVAECETVRQWVSNGGSLLLISDHAPAGEAALGAVLKKNG